MVTEKYPPMDFNLKFAEGGLSEEPKCLHQRIKLECKFPGDGVGVQTKKASCASTGERVGGYFMEPHISR